MTLWRSPCRSPPFERTAIDQLTHELPSALIHLAGALAFLGATPFLLARYRKRGRQGAAFYSFSLVFMFSMSCVFHLLTHVYGEGSAPSECFRQMDLTAIWIVMAGMFAPIQLTCFRGAWRWVPLAIVIAACALGVAVKLFLFGAFTLSANFAMYVLVAGVIVGAALQAIRLHGLRFMRLLVASWAVFAVGAYFFAVRPPDLIQGVIGQHEVWHTCVLGGAILHWVWVWRTAPFQPSTARAEALEPQRAFV